MVPTTGTTGTSAQSDSVGGSKSAADNTTAVAVSVSLSALVLAISVMAAALAVNRYLRRRKKNNQDFHAPSAMSAMSSMRSISGEVGGIGIGDRQIYIGRDFNTSKVISDDHVFMEQSGSGTGLALASGLPGPITDISLSASRDSNVTAGSNNSKTSKGSSWGLGIAAAVGPKERKDGRMSWLGSLTLGGSKDKEKSRSKDSEKENGNEKKRESLNGASSPGSPMIPYARKNSEFEVDLRSPAGLSGKRLIQSYCLSELSIVYCVVGVGRLSLGTRPMRKDPPPPPEPSASESSMNVSVKSSESIELEDISKNVVGDFKADSGDW